MTQQHDSLTAHFADHMARRLTVLELDPRVDMDLDQVLDTDEDGILDADYAEYIEIYAEVEVGVFYLWL